MAVWSSIVYVGADDQPGASAAMLSETAGIGPSTVTKLLTTLETAVLATRAAGEA